MELDTLCSMLTGHFNNEEQVEVKRNQGDQEYPEARHVNTICNDKINNLPSDFTGRFMLEESYYIIKGNCNPMPHLFLLEETAGGVKLSSYDMPEGYTKENFTYQQLGQLDYEKLTKSAKFTPIVYQKQEDGSYYGKSISMFSPILCFTLEETFSEECLLVSETFEVNGKRTFGYDDAIVYRREK